jgi:translation initiation factor IF-1
MSANQIRAVGTVIELLGRDACRVELPNGHRCIARAKKEANIALADQVTVEFHPYDLSRGWIVTPA